MFGVIVICRASGDDRSKDTVGQWCKRSIGGDSRASASVGQHTEGGCSRQDCDSSNCRTRTSTTLYGQSKRANAHEDEAAQWRRQG
eukprot:9019-Heterococcus_DN1.PRE.1